MLVLKSCSASEELCDDFGLREEDLFTFFVFFGLGLLLLLSSVSLLQLYLAEHAPKVIQIARAHGIPPSTIVRRA